MNRILLYSTFASQGQAVRVMITYQSPAKPEPRVLTDRSLVGEDCEDLRWQIWRWLTYQPLVQDELGVCGFGATGPDGF